MKTTMKAKLLKIILAIIGFATLFTDSACAADPVTISFSQTNEPSPFKITFIPSKKQVHIMEPFNICLVISNVSNTNRTFNQMSCSWDRQWKSNDPRVTLSCPFCIQNCSIPITLASGESFTNESVGFNNKMSVLSDYSAKKIIIRMGFTPMNFKDSHFESMPVEIKMRAKEFGLKDQGIIETGDKTYWSNEVTFEVLPN